MLTLKDFSRSVKKLPHVFLKAQFGRLCSYAT